jgi:chaperonin GroEL
MAKQFQLGEVGRNSMLRGMKIVAEIVGATLGPRSGTVVLDRPYGAGLITKDGVTVAEAISLPDVWENAGAKFLQEVARKTNQEAGDGTTAATILGHAIFKEGVKVVAAGANAMAIERGIQKGVAAVVAALAELSQPVDQSDLDTIRRVATISANSDAEMGDVIARAVHKVGLEGSVRVATSPTLETTLEISKGLQFDRGLISADFMADGPRGMTQLRQCNIFVTDRRLIDQGHMIAFMENYGKVCGLVPLLLLAEDIAEGALQALAANTPEQRRLKRQPPIAFILPVKLPGSGLTKKDEMHDIAIWSGARAYTVANGDDFTKAKAEDFGVVDEVTVTPRNTILVGSHAQALRLETRLDELRTRLMDQEAKEFEKAQIEKRLATLLGSVAVIKIGSSVQSKLLEKRDRVEDSVRSAQAALREGIVPGGGVALIRCLPALSSFDGVLSDEEHVGWKIVAKSLTQPLHRIATNAGQSGDVIVAEVMKFNWAEKQDPKSYIHAISQGERRHWGYNAATDCLENLIAAGIIDPTKVVRLALQNAGELAGLLLTSQALVVDIAEPQAAPQPPVRP